MGWFVYIVECSDNTFYTGSSNDVERRLYEHNHVDSKCPKYLKTRRPVKLVYTESAKNRGEALKRERKIKKMARKRKIEMIEESKLSFPETPSHRAISRGPDDT